MDALDTFLQNLERAQKDWSSIQAVFSDHAASRFLYDFITREIGALAEDPGHVVRKSVSQTTFTFINTKDFEYSVRILAPFLGRPHTVKWLGMRQIIAVKGRGSVTINRLTVPLHLDIASFQSGVVIDDVDIVSAADGDVTVTRSSHEIMDIYAVSSPVIVEVLTHRRDGSGLIWTFDQHLKSLYAEQSSATVSRFSNVLELAGATGRPIPDDVYDLALDPSKPHIAVLAIGSMLMSGHPNAFVQLQRAMDSGCKDLNEGAQRLFNFMMTARRDGLHATRN